MNGEERRQAIINTIEKSKAPISGSALAKMYGVSRQVIVHDIAILKMKYDNLYSTARGYMFSEIQDKSISDKETPTEILHGEVGENVRIFKVRHNDEETEAELNAIVDMGGTVVDVFVEHPVYGIMRGPLNISCRRHVGEFMEHIETGEITPLMHLTSGIHFHTVKADSEETLEIIEKELKKMNFLLVDTLE